MKNQQGRLTVLATGDLAPIHRPADLLANGSVTPVFGDVLDVIGGCDLSIANLECPLTDHQEGISKSGRNMKAAPHVVRGLKDAGFDIFTLANNHIMDYGDIGVKQTIEHLERHHLNHVGVGSTEEEAEQPLIINKNGLSVAILNFAEHEFNWASSGGWGTWMLDPAKNVNQIRACRDFADIVIVFVHGGNEHIKVPSPRMVRLYRAFVDAGAHAVVGHHPHAIMGIENYSGVPIAYSLGNFLFDSPGMKRPASWTLGLVLRMVFDSNGCIEFEPIPVQLDTENGGVKLIPEKHRDAFSQHFNKLSQVILNEEERTFYWNLYCVSKSRMYFKEASKSVLRAFPFLMKWLLGMLVGEPGSTSKKGMNSLRNLLYCESHHEAIASIVEILRTGKWSKYKSQLTRLDNIHLFNMDNY